MSKPVKELPGYFDVVKLPKVNQLRHQLKKSTFYGILVAVDPGETTGITVMECEPDGVVILHQEQLESWPLGKFIAGFDDILALHKPTFVVYESYHVYAWKLDQHSFSEVPTIQIIGSLKTLCVLRSILFGEQTAQTGKAFWTDDRLKTFDAFRTGMKHARDSLRHALQFAVFGLKPKQ